MADRGVLPTSHSFHWVQEEGCDKWRLEIVRHNGRYWIMTPNGPQWHDIGEDGVNPALNFLFIERER